MTMTADRIETSSPAVPEAAFELGYHAMTAAEMARHQRKHFDSLPRCPFSGLRVGERYAIADGHRKGAVWHVHKVSPSGSQVVASAPSHGPIRLYAGSYRGDSFALLDDLMASFVGVTHRAVVEEAVARGLPVPPPVRREYPELFVEVPDRFATGPHDTPAARVREAFSRVMGHTTLELVREWIESARSQITRWADERIRRCAINPDVAPDFDHIDRRALDDLDFYRWLLPLVEEGGVFHVD